MKKLALLYLVFVIWGEMVLFADEREVSLIYTFKEKSIDGEEVDFSQYKGKALLIVNVASHCGATDQYKGLQDLSEYFKGKGLVVLGFPTNDFGEQEPGSNQEIKTFCESNYQVTFPLFAKGPVKGAKKSELFKYLATAKNPDKTGEIGWNFEKFIIGKNGKLLRRFPTSVDPYDREFISAIETAVETR